MADCIKYREMISGYADGALSDNDKKELEEHLAECASCRTLLSLYSSISGAAEDSLADPPDNFAADIMSRIKALPGNETVHKPTAQKKSLRPVIISSAAAAACLALAFIVSPQLFGLRSTSEMAASVPNTITSTYDNGAQAPLPDTGGSQDQAPELGSTEPKIAAKAAPNSQTGDAASSSTAGSGAADDETSMSKAVGSEAPPPEPAQVTQFGTMMRADSAELKAYYAIFVINGQLPDALKDCSMTDNKDGTFNIEITAETANQLIKDGYKAEMGASEAEKALVKYTPAP